MIFIVSELILLSFSISLFWQKEKKNRLRECSKKQGIHIGELDA